MGIFNIFSKRAKKQRGELPDTYQYSDFPSSLRVQLVHLFRDATCDRANYQITDGTELLGRIHEILVREYGTFYLHNRHDEPATDLFNFLLNEEDPERLLDALELFCQRIPRLSMAGNRNLKLEGQQAISDLNARLREHGVGVEIIEGKAIRKDSALLHQEVVRETLSLIHQSKFQGVNQEFLKAHEHFRRGDFKAAIVEANKAFESALKIVCKSRKFKFSDSDTAKPLIDILFTNGFLPPFMQTYMGSLRSILESGLPTLRNKTTSAHGQGEAEVKISASTASFALNMSGSLIKYLLDSIGASPFA